MKTRLFDSQGADRLRVHRLSYQQDCGAIHAIGNGNELIYGRGPEWMQVFGAPYSCPTVLSMVIPEGDAVRCASRRLPGTGIWQHALEGGTITDCAPRAPRCLVRGWDLDRPVRFELDCHDFPVTDVSALLDASAWLIRVPATAAIYNDYPLMRRTNLMLCFTGDHSVEPCPTGLMATLRGKGALYVAAAADYPDCVDALNAARAQGFERLLSAVEAEDRAFLSRIADRRTPLRDHPLSGQAQIAADEVALLIRAQQHEGGGVQAGHNYHLAYVRDQYGVSRGLLAAGAWENARAILEFYRGVFARHGKICNAQAMGVDGVFHVHENDQTEITGYLLVQAADYLAATDDADFFRSLTPMLNWALQAQLACLHNDMLPFNGDETYVAGGIVPRTILNHGSFEATLLLLTGGRRYLAECARLGIPVPGAAEAGERLDRVSARFEENFRRSGDYAANSLKRLNGLTEPEYRHGVCLSGDFFGWLKHTGEGCYYCPNCLTKPPLPPCREEYALKSTLLMAPFVNATQLESSFLVAKTRSFLDEYRATGRLPSRPDGDACLGYDFGLMLFAAARAGLDADDLLAHMFSLEDEAGAWSEYFVGTIHRQTRCRPWESAINVAGALEYLKQR